MQRAEDDEILRVAVDERRVLISEDTDFGVLRLARSGSRVPSFVLVRGADALTPDARAALIAAALPQIASELDAGCIAVSHAIPSPRTSAADRTRHLTSRLGPLLSGPGKSVTIVEAVSRSDRSVCASAESEAGSLSCDGYGGSHCSRCWRSRWSQPWVSSRPMRDDGGSGAGHVAGSGLVSIAETPSSPHALGHSVKASQRVADRRWCRLERRTPAAGTPRSLGRTTMPPRRRSGRWCRGTEPVNHHPQPCQPSAETRPDQRRLDRSGIDRDNTRAGTDLRTDIGTDTRQGLDASAPPRSRPYRPRCPACALLSIDEFARGFDSPRPEPQVTDDYCSRTHRVGAPCPASPMHRCEKLVDGCSTAGTSTRNRVSRVAIRPSSALFVCMDEQLDYIGIERGSSRTTADAAPLLLTIPQAALVLAVGRTTVYELVAAGDLDVVHIGRSVRIPVDALRSFVNRRATRTSPARAAGASRTEGSRCTDNRGGERRRGEYGSQLD